MSTVKMITAAVRIMSALHRFTTLTSSLALLGRGCFDLVAAMLSPIATTVSSLDFIPRSPELTPETLSPMSRRTDYTALPTGEQSLQDEEAISATGEGDEDMEDAEDQEDGYSAYMTPHTAGLNLTCSDTIPVVSSHFIHLP